MSAENGDDIVRVLRLVEYEGPRGAVEAQVAISIHGTRQVRVLEWPRGGVRITAVTLGVYPEVIEEARRTADVPGLKAMSDTITSLHARVDYLSRKLEEKSA